MCSKSFESFLFGKLLWHLFRQLALCHRDRLRVSDISSSQQLQYLSNKNIYCSNICPNKNISNKEPIVITLNVYTDENICLKITTFPTKFSNNFSSIMSNNFVSYEEENEHNTDSATDLDLDSYMFGSSARNNEIEMTDIEKSSDQVDWICPTVAKTLHLPKYFNRPIMR